MTPDRLIAACALPRLEARVLLAHASARTREWLIAHGDEALPQATVIAFERLVARRQAGEPIAYLVGHREFHGLRFAVTPSVLIPRPETESLVDEALKRADQGARVLDLGTGSGAIAIALTHARPDLRLVAADRSAEALAVARANAAALLPPAVAAGIDWREGSWWTVLSAGERFALILANPPYIAEGDAHLAQGDLRFEPRQALTAGADGLADLRCLCAGATRWLAPGGSILLEHGHDQGEAVRGMMREAGLRKVVTLHDDQGKARITLGEYDACGFLT